MSQLSQSTTGPTLLPAHPSQPDPMTPRPFRVTRTRRELADTVTFDAVPADGEESPLFAPGQFNMLYAPGVGEIPVSISGDPGSRRALTHTVRAVGAVSGALRGLRRGAVVGVRGPYGRGWPVEAARGGDLVIVAGGIGLAPLRSVVYETIARRAAFGRVIVLYGARTPDEILYVSGLERWRTRFGLDIAITVDRAPASWRGSVGVVTRLIPHANFDTQRTVALVCGPEIMMRFTAAELIKRGIAPERMYLSMERNMKCAVGFCGHCQYGPFFVCRDGPVFSYNELKEFLTRPEL